MSAFEGDTIGELLHSHGLRSTPQRRAIMAALSDSGEHLSADQVHALALPTLPNLGRGTVYATLAELTELGALRAVGVSEPVRYEANTSPHAHFRCRLCRRLFDLDSDLSKIEQLVDDRFAVERVMMRAEGVCENCSEYQAGLLAGITAIHTPAARMPWSSLLQGRDVACASAPGPLGLVLLAATSAGLARLAFEEHADAGELRERAAARRGSVAAREHLRSAKQALGSFLGGEQEQVECTVDPEILALGGEALQATRSIPHACHRSYARLDISTAPHETGIWMGANPIPIVFPCHRVSRGDEVPQVFVGGLERRQWLERHELGDP